MPPHRRRSRSRDRSRSESPERNVQLPEGVEPISESDYFLKSDEFRVWLKEEKQKVIGYFISIQRMCLIVVRASLQYMDELTSDKSRK